MIKRLQEYFKNADPDKQKRLSSLLVIAVCIVVALAGYYMRGGKPKKKQDESAKISDLQPRLGYLEKSLYYETTNKIKAMDEKLEALELQLKALNARLENQKTEKTEKVESKSPDKTGKKGLENKITSPFGKDFNVLNSIIREKTNARKGRALYPTPPRRTGTTPSRTRPGSGQRTRKFIGDIGTVEGSHTTNIPKKSGAKKGKRQEGVSVYLPPSFMEADLISGFMAPTMEAAKSEPVRVFLRIRDLAVLPNRVKGDLKGCFAIAEAYGNLADERAHLRLLRLSCIARDGSSVIDEDIKGFVIDEDGRIGLRGRVVTKMGALLARSMAASFLQGFGDAYAATGLTVNTSGIGQTASLNPSEAFKSGIGRGISGGSKEFSKFYLDLARQTFPGIEVGAGKRITMVIDHGVDLAIKEKCLGGKNGCKGRSDTLYALDNF